jgi:DNA polymerase I
MPSDKRLFLLDAYALIYRAYYAFIKNPRINSKGQNTSAVFGFVNTLEDIIKRENPTHIAVCFDPHGPTFRHEAFEQYKAQREETPEVIRWSVPFIKKIIEAYNIPILEVMGFEADDVIGTISRKAENAGFKVYMMTPDKDCGQLVTDNIFMYRPKYGGNEFEILGIEEVKQKYGLNSPLQMIDLLGLMGDSSDNIPGCPGVGEVTAKKLLDEFGSIDSLLRQTDKLKGSLKEKISNNIELIKFSKFLATIRTDVPIDFNEEQLIRESANMEELHLIYEDLEFRTMLGRMGKFNQPIPDDSKKTFIKEPKKPIIEKDQFSLWDAFGMSTTGEIKTDDQKLLSPEIDSTKNLFKDSELSPENEKNPDDSQDEKKYSNLASLKTTPHSYHLIDNELKMADFIEKISFQNFFSLDTETTSVDAMNAELVGMSFSWKKNEAFYIPFPSNQKESREKISKLKSILENDKILVIGQNIKYDLVVLKKYGINIHARIFDTMIAHYLLQPELRHNMDYLAEIYLNYQTIHIDELIGTKGKNQKNMRDIPPAEVCPYASEDADITLQLKYVLENELKNANIDFLTYDVEMPLVKVLAEMEFSGVALDNIALEQSSKTMTSQLAGLEKEIQQLAGEEFNVNSPKQLGDILFEKLEIGGKPKKTKTGQYSTSEETLEKLRNKHPVIEKILEQRGLKKLLSTYIDALPTLINPKTGKIHTSFNQAVTSTGRLSSSNPNLQNIPVRDEIGREIRKAFAAGNNEYFFSADYSQIELRLMAHLSEDPNMIEAFIQNQDIHAATASKIYKIPIEEVTQEMRRKAKTANFGIIYGISVFGLAERMSVSRTEAKELIDGYFETYPNVKKYMDKAIQDAKKNGCVETLFHRKRYLPDIGSQNAVVRGYAERNAINAPIQGTAADIIKIAMVRIQKAIEDYNLKSKMILQVHDELDFIVPKDELETITKLVTKEMESAVSLLVPLKADTGYGSNWLEAH